MQTIFATRRQEQHWVHVQGVYAIIGKGSSATCNSWCWPVYISEKNSRTYLCIMGSWLSVTHSFFWKVSQWSRRTQRQISEHRAFSMQPCRLRNVCSYSLDITFLTHSELVFFCEVPMQISMNLYHNALLTCLQELNPYPQDNPTVQAWVLRPRQYGGLLANKLSSKLQWLCHHSGSLVRHNNEGRTTGD